MGARHSKGTTVSSNESGAKKDSNEISVIQDGLKNTITIPTEVLIAHFTPSNFPLTPIITSRTTALCEESWNFILESSETNFMGVTTSGVIAFYNEFYDRLGSVDTNGKFGAILSRHGQNDIAAKGAILIRVVKAVLSIRFDSDQVQFLLFMLGKSHAKKGIRPWQYSVFTQTLLNTIASRLGTKASSNVMEAWVHLFAFCLRSMLPPSIRGQIIENEVHINTSSEFNSEKVFNEVAEIEEIKQYNRRPSARSASVASEGRPATFADAFRQNEASIMQVHGNKYFAGEDQ